MIRLFGTAEQREVVFAPARFLCLIAARRWGKTFAVRNRIIKRCLSTTKPNFHYMYIAPQYAQVQETFEALSSHPFLHDFFSCRPKKQPFPSIRWVNGARTDFRSFDRPKGIRSGGPDEIWVDEIQDIDEKNFDHVVMPMIRNRRGTLGMSGQFRHSWYHDKFYVPGQEGPDSRRPLYWSWRFNYRSAMVYQGKLGEQEVIIAREQTPANVWKVEYECDPAANDRAAFVKEQIDLITTAELLSSPRDGRRYIMGLDLGRVRDPSAVVVMDAESGEVHHAETFALGMTHEAQAVRAGEIAKRWRAVVACDTTGGATGGRAPIDSYVKHYRRMIPNLHAVHWNVQIKLKLIEELSLAIERGSISLCKEHDELLRQLKNYEAVFKNGYYHYSAPKNEHDDYVSALAMANYARICGWNSGGMSPAFGIF